MSGEDELETNDFNPEEEVTEQGSVDVNKSADSDMRRRLEDELEERRLRKSIQDYDFDLD